MVEWMDWAILQHRLEFHIFDFRSTAVSVSEAVTVAVADQCCQMERRRTALTSFSMRMAAVMTRMTTAQYRPWHRPVCDVYCMRMIQQSRGCLRMKLVMLLPKLQCSTNGMFASSL
eukprot:13879530-Ditylum_brightwellii.AAC.1